MSTKYVSRGCDRCLSLVLELIIHVFRSSPQVAGLLSSRASGHTIDPAYPTIWSGSGCARLLSYTRGDIATAEGGTAVHIDPSGRCYLPP
jgi:hypothetical protein